MRKAVEKLIESVDIDKKLDESTRKQMTDEIVESFNKKLDDAKADAKKECETALTKECNARIAEAKRTGFAEGVHRAMSECKKQVAEAEENGFKAGTEDAKSEADELDGKLGDELSETLKKFAVMTDKTFKLIQKATKEATHDKDEEDMTESLDSFLTESVARHLPEKYIIDLDRSQKLEHLLESVKKTLSVSDAEVNESVKKIEDNAKQQLTEAKATVQEQIHLRIASEHKAKMFEAENALLKKIAPLPSYEQRVLKARFQNSDVKDINENFDAEYKKLCAGRAGAAIEKPVVASVVSEAAERRVVDTASEKKAVTESTEKKPVNETAESVDPTMSAYVAGCQRLETICGKSR
jgi:hypothetical protein